MADSNGNLPLLDVEIGFKKEAPDLFLIITMWGDEVETLNDLLMAKENRGSTDFHVLRADNGGTITIDLSSVLYVTTLPYGEGEDTTVEVEYIYGEDDGYW